MNLTQQFLIIALLPLCFVGMAIYMSQTRERKAALRWMMTLILGAVWSSAILRYFGGLTFSTETVAVWGVVGQYAFLLMAFFLLQTAVSHLNLSQLFGRFAIILTFVLGLAAAALDPTLWPYQIPETVLLGVSVRHFDLWIAVWIAAWLTAVVGVLTLIQQRRRETPPSLYRNQLNYWLLLLAFFAIGSGFGSVQRPEQPGWLQASSVLVLGACFIGTITISRSQLPDLQLAIRRLLSQLSGATILFVLVWGAFVWIAFGVGDLISNVNSRALVVFISALLFTALFTSAYRLSNALVQRLFLPTPARRRALLSDYSNTVGNFPEPEQLAQLFLRLLESNFNIDDCWFWTISDGPGGKLVLQPLATLVGETDVEAQTAVLSSDNPVAAYWRGYKTAVTQQEINTLALFNSLRDEERDKINAWGRRLFVPLHAGDSLVGLLGIGERQEANDFSRAELGHLLDVVAQFSPLLAQVQNAASLRQINDFVFQQNRLLLRDRQQLNALTKLYAQFIQLVTPDLRDPLTDINNQLRRMQDKSLNGLTKDVDKLGQHVARLKQPVDRLITMAGRLMAHHEFNFSLLQLDELGEKAVRRLKTMADARRVTVELLVPEVLPPISGDEEQLVEAIRQLLHNAIKFNKLGGTVTLTCGLQNSEAFLRVQDRGVGMPSERLSKIWSGLANLNEQANGRFGTGMGLALTHFIVDAHGGRLEASSTYGRGSTFTIFIPLAFEEQT